MHPMTTFRLPLRRAFQGTAPACLCLGLALFATQASPAAPRAKLSKQAAEKIALGKEAGKVKSGELEHEKGRWIYSFDIVQGTHTHEVNVDANTGEVVEDSIENPADEAREQAAEKKPS